MSDDEINEEVEQTSTPIQRDQDVAKQLEKLNEYVEQMAYQPVKPQPASDRTQALSKAPKKYIAGTYAEHKDTFQPKERSDRVGRIVKEHSPITIEHLEEFIRKHRKKQAQFEKDKKQQQINYQETLLKLQKQCEHQLMNAIVQKFAKMTSKRASCISSSRSSVETESYQVLQQSVFCQMILDLKVPNEHQTRDVTVYKKLASVFADLILQALFLAHNSDGLLNDQQDEEQQLPKPTERDLIIKFRALRAAKKKLYQKRQKSARGFAVLSNHLNKYT